MPSWDYITVFLPSSLSSTVLCYKAVGVWGLETKEGKPDEVKDGSSASLLPLATFSSR